MILYQIEFKLKLNAKCYGFGAGWLEPVRSTKDFHIKIIITDGSDNLLNSVTINRPPEIRNFQLMTRNSLGVKCIFWGGGEWERYNPRYLDKFPNCLRLGQDSRIVLNEEIVRWGAWKWKHNQSKESKEKEHRILAAQFNQSE